MAYQNDHVSQLVHVSAHWTITKRGIVSEIVLCSYAREVASGRLVVEKLSVLELLFVPFELVESLFVIHNFTMIVTRPVKAMKNTYKGLVSDIRWHPELDRGPEFVRVFMLYLLQEDFPALLMAQLC